MPFFTSRRAFVLGVVAIGLSIPFATVFAASIFVRDLPSAPTSCGGACTAKLLTMSGDGTRVFLADQSDQILNDAAHTMLGGRLYLSSNDGATWSSTQTSLAPPGWQSIAMDATGQTLYAVGRVTGPYGVYRSTDFGANWARVTDSPASGPAFGNTTFSAVYLSADGSRALLVGNGIYTSGNANENAPDWVRTPIGYRVWDSAAISTDGTRMALLSGQTYYPNSYSPYVYTSNDGGASWVQQEATAGLTLSHLTASGDLRKMAAISRSDGFIYVSADYGVHWRRTGSGSVVSNLFGSAPLQYSADGSRLFSLQLLPRTGSSPQSYALFFSIDDGTTWLRASDSLGPLSSGYPGGFAIASSGTKAVVMLNAVQVVTGIVPLAPLAAPRASLYCPNLTMDLEQGGINFRTASNEQASAFVLQTSRMKRFLADYFNVSPADANLTSSFFDDTTKEFVIKFQEEQGITPAVGYVGRLTRAAIERVCAAGTRSSSPATGSVATATAPAVVTSVQPTAPVTAPQVPLAPAGPTGTLSVVACTPGSGSTFVPGNAAICDSTASWTAVGATGVYAVVTGDFPYTSVIYPNGFTLPLSGSTQPIKFWTPVGTYKVTLYANGDFPTATRAGTGTKIAETTITVASPSVTPVAATPVVVNTPSTQQTQATQNTPVTPNVPATVTAPTAATQTNTTPNTVTPSPVTVTPPVVAAPTGTLTLQSCTLGGSKLNTTRTDVCDASMSWTTQNAANRGVYVVITGQAPYWTAVYPHGYTPLGGWGATGSNLAFWVQAGTYTVSLYADGTHPTVTSAGTGVKLDEKTITIAPQTVSISERVSQVASAAAAVIGNVPFLGGWFR